jgi:hypothetical protein
MFLEPIDGNFVTAEYGPPLHLRGRIDFWEGKLETFWSILRKTLTVTGPPRQRQVDRPFVSSYNTEHDPIL